MGEVTTLERGGVVTFLVLNAPGPAYLKLRDEYVTFVKSLGPLTPPPGSPSPAAPPSPPAPGPASPAPGRG
jgi:hypothetical protein